MSMNKERAWKLLEDISFVRVAGTPEDKKAAELLKAECDKAGVPAVIEEYEIDIQTVTLAKLEVLEPEYHAFPVIGLGNTACTPDEGIEGGFKYIDDATDVSLVDIAGKVVLYQGRGGFDLMDKLKKAGAIGYIASYGNMYEDESIKNELRPGSAFGKDPAPVPGLRIHITEAEKLVRMNPTKVRITNQNESSKGTSYNVVATIEGTDLKDEIIAFSAHYDSVPYSKGSWDNGTGSVSIAELMHHFKEIGSRRTLKFIWCGAEEIGLVGSREYCKAHEEELKNYIFNINFDMTGVTIGYETCVCSTSEETMHAISYVASLNAYPSKIELGTYSSDSTSFATAGVPACSFARLSPQGGMTFHNHLDTMEHLDADTFMKTVGFVAIFAEQIANAPVNPIPRKFAKTVTERLDQMKKMRAGMEKKDEKKPEGDAKPEEKKEETK